MSDDSPRASRVATLMQQAHVQALDWMVQETRRGRADAASTSKEDPVRPRWVRRPRVSLDEAIECLEAEAGARLAGAGRVATLADVSSLPAANMRDLRSCSASSLYDLSIED
jgi:hypothetical protein